MNDSTPIVYVVDDDYRVREALESLLSSLGYEVALFGSAAEFLAADKLDAPGCLVLDLQLPGASGLELQEQLVTVDAPPIIFLTGHGNIAASVRAMKAGAVEFLPKPFGEDQLLKAIEEAILLDRVEREKRLAVAEVRRRYNSLSRRERDVLPFVVAGFANKVTAAELGTSEITIGVHRGQVMRKMGARSLAELIRMADKLGITRPPETSE